MSPLVGVGYIIFILVQLRWWLLFAIILVAMFLLFRKEERKFQKRWIGFTILLWLLLAYSQHFIRDYFYKLEYALGYSGTAGTTPILFLIACSILLTLSIILYTRVHKMAAVALLTIVLVLAASFPRLTEWVAEKTTRDQMNQDPLLRVAGISAPYRQGFTIPYAWSGFLILSAHNLEPQRIAFQMEPRIVPLSPGEYKVCSDIEEANMECYLVSLKPDLLVRLNLRQILNKETFSMDFVFQCLPEDACKKL